MADLGGQIRRAASFFCCAALRRWQVVSQGWCSSSCIPLNKVRKGSFDLGFSGQPWPRLFLRLLDDVLRRSKLMKKRRSGGFHKAESLALYCIYSDLPPLACKSQELTGGFMHLVHRWGAELCGVSREEELDLLCRNGCEEKRRLVGSEAPRGISATATCRDHQRRRFCASVIHGRRGRSVLWRSLRHDVFNLQAGMPVRRPFLSSAAAPIVAPSPSGLVPGGGADGRCVELPDFGGEGSNCIPLSFVMVLFVKSKDLDVFCFFFEVLDVKCNPTE